MGEHTYIGLADCNGLSSFIPDYTQGKGVRFNRMFLGNKAEDKVKELQSMLHGMYMSAQANPQRWTVAYQAKVTAEVADEINELMKEGEIIDALITLKTKASEIGLLGTPNSKKFWERIPDPSLDPFGS